MHYITFRQWRKLWGLTDKFWAWHTRRRARAEILLSGIDIVPWVFSLIGSILLSQVSLTCTLRKHPKLCKLEKINNPPARTWKRLQLQPVLMMTIHKLWSNKWLPLKLVKMTPGLHLQRRRLCWQINSNTSNFDVSMPGSYLSIDHHNFVFTAWVTHRYLDIYSWNNVFRFEFSGAILFLPTPKHG